MVALRKESVDRNTILRCLKRETLLSLSARRAWIEITNLRLASLCGLVALRKESVDRNANAPPEEHKADSRSPQGERG